MAAVLGRTIKNGITGGAFNNGREEVTYYDSRRGCLSSSFAPYYIVTIALNSVAIAGGVVSQFDYHRRRNGYGFYWVDSWYLCNGIFGVLHILAAIYLVRKIEEPNLPNEAAPPTANRDIVLRDPPYNPSVYNNMGVPVPQQPQYAAQYPAQHLPTHAVSPVSEHPPTEPETYARVNHVLMESKLFAVYILVFAAYVIWHKFYDIRTWQTNMVFVMKCADIFIVAGPCSLLFSIVLMLMKRREI